MMNRKSNAAVKVQTTMLDRAASLLGDLPEKPDSTISLRQAIEMLQQDLRASLDKGYGYEELAQVLAEQEIDISPSTLKRYLAMSQKGSPQRRPRRSRKTGTEPNQANESQVRDAEHALESIAG